MFYHITLIQIQYKQCVYLSIRDSKLCLLIPLIYDNISLFRFPGVCSNSSYEQEKSLIQNIPISCQNIFAFPSNLSHPCVSVTLTLCTPSSQGNSNSMYTLISGFHRKKGNRYKFSYRSFRTAMHFTEPFLLSNQVNLILHFIFSESFRSEAVCHHQWINWGRVGQSKVQQSPAQRCSSSLPVSTHTWNSSKAVPGYGGTTWRANHEDSRRGKSSNA